MNILTIANSYEVEEMITNLSIVTQDLPLQLVITALTLDAITS